jgi:hypothetical protein
MEVKDAAGVLADLDRTIGMFVPTRLALPLGGVFVLALRLPRVERSIEIPMLVMGRRVPRGGSLLSGGVNCRPADPRHPMLEVLREVVAGRVVDLEARIVEQSRTPCSATYHTTADANADLRALLEGPTAIPVDTLLERGERAVLTVASQEHGVLLTPHVLVRTLHDRDGERLATLELLDNRQRTIVNTYLIGTALTVRRA